MNDLNQAISTVWEALEAYREFLIPEGNPDHDKIWDEVCSSMSIITEQLNEQEEQS